MFGDRKCALNLFLNPTFMQMSDEDMVKSLP